MGGPSLTPSAQPAPLVKAINPSPAAAEVFDAPGPPDVPTGGRRPPAARFMSDPSACVGVVDEVGVGKTPASSTIRVQLRGRASGRGRAATSSGSVDPLHLGGGPPTPGADAGPAVAG